VSQERAAVGVRALESEADRLSRSLALAIQPAAEARQKLTAMAAARASDWPGLHVWWRQGRTLERLVGGPLEQEGAVASWVDSLGSLPERGVVLLGGSTFIGAARRMAGQDAGAVALLPLPPLLADMPARISGGRLTLIGVTPGPWDSLARPTEGGVRARVTNSGPRARITATDDTVVVGDFVAGDFLQGLVWVDGLHFSPSGWERERLPLSSHAVPGEVLAGLYRRAQESQLGLVPLILVALVAGLFVMIALWDVIIVTNMGRSITSVVGALRNAAVRLEAGDLAHRIEVKGRDDLWSVAEALNTATEGLARAREREKEQQRIESELLVARRIQSRLLPEAPPRMAGWEIAGYYDPAREVGGDYFDHLPAGEGRLLLVIADVSGKSVPAALIMSAFRAALHAQDMSGLEPRELVERLNRFLHHSLDPGKFVTAFLGFLETSGRLAYVNAGHNPPLVLHRDGSHKRLEKGGTILGILPMSRYEQAETRLASGDLVALYTDGVIEGMNEKGELWGEDRLIETLRAGTGHPCAEVAATIAAQVRAFEGEQGATDDITLLLARRES
jgi:serine phosphatase RsbU (regulator of sigma subunit)